MPSSAWNSRDKWRGLTPATLASAAETQVRARIFEDVKPNPVDRTGGCGLRGQRRAELRLPAGSLQKNDEPACHPQGQSAPMILLDQRKGEVDRRSHPGGAEDRPVANEDSVGFDLDIGIFGGKAFGILPVGRDAAPRQQSRMGQQEGARTGRAVAPRLHGLLRSQRVTSSLGGSGTP